HRRRRRRRKPDHRRRAGAGHPLRARAAAGDETGLRLPVPDRRPGGAAAGSARSEAVRMTGYIMSVLVSAGIFALLAQGLNLHWGYTGLLNFGIVAFFAVGAYTMAIFVSELGWSIW